ncbi:MAG TPA: hypothetical protein VFE24_04720 [Pirellulales bacterium]|jgi:hypothetical protein|nr:hypothetical protein [Pirellulales bacterium]
MKPTNSKQLIARTVLALFALFVLIAAQASAQATAAQVYHGRVTSAAVGMISIEIPNAPPIAFSVSPAARIMRNGKVTKLEGLRVGDRVSIMLDASKMAVAIDAHSRRGG